MGMANPPVRLLDFISEQEVAEIRKRKGETGETETVVPDRPLFEILKENKDKQQAEFNERFKHRPPKALDEDETEFLEQLETVSLILCGRSILGTKESMKNNLPMRRSNSS